MGNEATLLIRPELKLNEVNCDLSLLKNLKATLTTTNFVDNIPVTKNFDNLKIEKGKEIPISFQVPPNLQNLEISFECEVRNISKRENEKLEASEEIDVNTNINNSKYYEAFLRRMPGEGEGSGDYFFYALGKNGEPLPNMSVEFNLGHTVYEEKQKATLETDEEGKIKLGDLKNITEVTASFSASEGDCARTWALPKQQENFDYPNDIDILVDEEITLPVPIKELDPSEVNLIRYSERDDVISNEFESLSLTSKKGYFSNVLTISNLKAGNYTLILHYLELGGFDEITVKVHEGVYWEKDNFVLKKNAIVDLYNQKKFLRFHKVKFSDLKEESKGEEEKNSVLTFKVDNADKKTRAHVFAFTFMPDDLENELHSMNTVCDDDNKEGDLSFNQWINSFDSNRKLGDEYKYVFNRKYAKRFMGNTLDKPQLIMKRLKVKDTNFDNEVIKEGTQYNNQPVSRKRGGRTRQTARKSTGGKAPRRHLGTKGISRSCIRESEDPYYGFQNFLRHSSFLQENLVADKKGKFSCELPSSRYTNIMILATNSKTCSQLLLDLEDAPEEIEKRNLSLTSPLDPKKYFTEVRATENVFQKSVYKINDITSTEYVLVDSLDKVRKLSEDLAQINRRTIVQDLMFLFNWSDFSESEKHKKYDTYQCHEMNLFLYFKDPEYFTSVAKPFISSKMEKTFLDYWLLSDYDSILHYQEIGYFDKLNYLEKTLLIYTLTTVDKKAAKVLADRISLACEALPKVSSEVSNKMFDTVLALNLLQKDDEAPEELRAARVVMDEDMSKFAGYGLVEKMVLETNNANMYGGLQGSRGGRGGRGGFRSAGRGRGKGYGKVGAKRH